MKHRSLLFTLALLASTAPVWAQPATRPAPNMQSLGYAVLSTLIFGLLGVGIAIAGFKLFDAATPFHLEREICEKQNLAAALLAGFTVLGICIIVAATVLS